MRREHLGRSWAARLSVLGLVSAVWLLGAGREAFGGPVDDGAPSGAVAFFGGGVCPTGWSAATEAQGRLIVGVIDAPNVGLAVGAALADQEDRPHEHTYKGMVDLPYKSVSAADGANQSGAKAGMYEVSGDTATEVSGLPFIQVQACVKQ